MKTKHLILWAALLGVAASIHTAHADTRTWNGSANNNWRNDSNWSGGGSPGSSDAAVFPAGENQVVVDYSNASGDDVDRTVAEARFHTVGTDTTSEPGFAVNWYHRDGRLTTGILYWSSTASDRVIKIHVPFHVPGGHAMSLQGSGVATHHLYSYGDISGSGVVETSTASDDVVHLFSANSFSGTFNVIRNTLFLRHNNALPAATLSVTDSGSINMDGYSPAIGHLIGSRSVTLPAGTILSVGAKNLSGIYSGVFSGAGRLTKNGSGTWTLSAANTYSGETTINGGAILLNGSGSLTNSGITLNPAGTLICNAATTLGNISGNGTLDLNANTTIRGTTFLNPTFNGTLNGAGYLSHDSPGTLTINGTDGNFSGRVITGSTDGGVLKTGGTRFQDSLVTIQDDNSLDITSATTLGQLGGAGALVLDHALTFGGKGTDTTYVGALSGTGTVTKTGAGTWFYNRTGDSMGAVTIAGGALGGTGTLPSAVTVNSGAMISPGASGSLGTLSFASNVDLNGTLAIQADGTSNDVIEVAGNLDLRTSTLAHTPAGAGITGPVVVFARYGTLTGTFANITGLPYGYAVVHNYNDGSSTNNLAIVETLAPRITSFVVNQAAAVPTFHITFDAEVLGFTAADLAVVVNGLTGTPVLSLTGSGSNYTATVTGLVGEGSVSIRLANNAAMTSRIGTPANITPGAGIHKVAEGTLTQTSQTSLDRTWNAAGGDFLIVYAQGYDQWDAKFNGGATVTFGGQAMTRVANASYNTLFGFNARVTIFHLANPPAGDHTLTVNMPPNTSQSSITKKYWVRAVSVTGVESANPLVVANEIAGQFDHLLTLANVPAGAYSIYGACYYAHPGGQIQVNGQSADTYPGGAILDSTNFPGTGSPGGARRVIDVASGTTASLTIDPDSASSSTIATAVGASFAPAAYYWSVPVVTSVVPVTTGPTNATNLAFTVTFSEPVQDFDAFNDLVIITASGDATATSATFSGSGASYTVTLTGVSGDGTLRLAPSLASGITDMDSSPLAATKTSAAVTVDHTAPRVTSFTTGTPSPTHADSVTYEIEISEPVIGLVDGSDLFITPASTATTDLNAAVITPAGDGIHFSITLHGVSGEGPLQFRPKLAQITDAAGNSLVDEAAAYSPVVTFDHTAPVITLNGAANMAIAVGAAWSDPGATATDNLDGSVAVITGGDTVNTSASGVFTITYNATDSAGNAAAQVTRTVTVDTPPAAISIVPATRGPTHVDSISFAVWFSEAVTNFNAFNDLVVTTRSGSATAAGATITGSGTIYTVTLTGISGDGVFYLAVSTTSDVRDSLGLALASSLISVDVFIDNTPPVITRNGAASATLAIGAAWTDPGATATDSLDGNVAVITGGDTVNTSAPGIYTITYNATDAAGNAAAQVTRTVTVDATLPVVTAITPATTGPTKATSIVFTVAFSEPVLNFGAFDDLVVTTVSGDAIATGATFSGSGASYTVTLTGVSGDGALTLEPSLNSDISDADTNALQVTKTSAVVAVDHTAPHIVSFTTSSLSPTRADSISYEIEFGEPVIGFVDGTDIFLSVNTVATTDLNAAVVTPAGDGLHFTVTLNGIAGDGLLQFRPRLAQVTDPAGNFLVDEPAAYSPAIIVDNSAALAITSVAGGDAVISLAERDGGFTVTGTVAGIEDGRAVSVSFTDASSETIHASTLVSGGTWTLDTATANIFFTNLADGTLTLTAAATDFASNPASDSLSLTLDTDPNSPVNNPFVAWTLAKGLTAGVNNGPLDDPDGDGDPNYVEFARDGNPLSAAADGKRRVSIYNYHGFRFLSLTVPVRLGAVFAGAPGRSATIDGVTYQVDGALEVGNFNSAVVTGSATDDAGLPALSPGWAYRSFWLNQQVATSPTGFLRLHVSPAP